MPEEKGITKRRLREALEGHVPINDAPVPPAPARTQPEPPNAERNRPPQPLQPRQQPPQAPQARQPEERREAMRRGLDRTNVITLREVESLLSRGNTRGNLPVMTVAGENAASQQTIVSSWLGADYLALAPTRDTPRLLTESPAYFVPFLPTLGPINGLYVGGTAEVHVSSDISSRADRLRVITHEDLHYFSRGGTEVRWQGPDGQTVRMGYARWFNEGLTECFAQQVARDNGASPSFVAYPMETSAAYLLQVVVAAAVGDERRAQDVLLTAYMTGDFTTVRVFTDMVLGNGSFEAFARQDNGAEAFSFMLGKVHGLGDTSMLQMRRSGDYRLPPNWEDNPIYRLAAMQMVLEGGFSDLAGSGESGRRRPLGRN